MGGMMQKGHLTFLFFLVAIPALMAQQPSNRLGKKLDEYKIKMEIGLQLWGSYTLGQKVYDSKDSLYHPVDDRLNFQIRRTRIGFKGQPYPNLQFNLTAALDLVGRDLLSGTEAGVNNGASPQFRLWNAYVQWRLTPENEKLNLIIGYLPPQIGRESITAALRSTSMEKAWSQNYLRRHLTGIAPGRAPGLHLGGLFWNKATKTGWRYDVGVFSPVYESYNGNSTGKQYAPLLVGRLLFAAGMPESDKYSVSHKINYFGKRQGLSIALAGATQGATDLFHSSQTLGADVLLHFGQWTLDGDWTYLWRSGLASNDQQNTFLVSAQTGYIRLGYNFDLPKDYVLEPVAMYVAYEGEMEKTAQDEAQQVGMPAGEEYIFDLGFNFYFNPDLRLSLHYTWRNADAGESGPGATVNNYFFQGGVGAIQRGDWVGLGLIGFF
ncbi:MAG TPA: porin [Saprospiraceae bacterium]|nr:porin [Saprospiraceae bacterium]HMQ83263.1 porin [Saprospiraceae bacterium]